MFLVQFWNVSPCVCGRFRCQNAKWQGDYLMYQHRFELSKCFFMFIEHKIKTVCMSVLINLSPEYLFEFWVALWLALCWKAIVLHWFSYFVSLNGIRFRPLLFVFRCEWPPRQFKAFASPTFALKFPGKRNWANLLEHVAVVLQSCVQNLSTSALVSVRHPASDAYAFTSVIISSGCLLLMVNFVSDFLQ